MGSLCERTAQAKGRLGPINTSFSGKLPTAGISLEIWNEFQNTILKQDKREGNVLIKYHSPFITTVWNENIHQIIYMLMSPSLARLHVTEKETNFNL